MNIIGLEIRNFLAIGEACISLYRRGLVLIQGQNLDDGSAGSNGSGKSSIVDALAWVFYGVTARGVSGDAVVNNVAKKNASVIATVRDGSTTYKISRYRKHSIYKNQLRVEAITDGSATVVDLTKGTERETQEVINQIMGCSLDVFMAAIYAGQEVMPDIPKMTDKQLKLLIEEAAGVDRLESAYLIAREKLNDTKLALQRSAASEASYKSQLVSVLANKELASKQYDQFELDRNTKAEQARKLAGQCDVDIHDLTRKLDSLHEEHYKKRASEINVQIAGNSAMQKELENIDRNLKQQELVLARAQANFDNEAKKLKELKGRFDNAETLVKQPCHACGKPGDEHDLETFKDHSRKAVLTCVEGFRALSEAKGRAETTVNELKQQRASYAATIPDISSLTKESREVMEQLSKISSVRNDIAAKKVIQKDYEESAKLAMTELNPHEKMRTALLEDTFRIGKLLKAERERVKELQDQVDIYDNVVRVFGPAGVRAHILDTVTPFLNDRTSDYLSALSDGNINAVWSTLTTTAKGELKEKFNIEVTNDKGASSFMGLSGGEKRKVRLSTMLALQDLVASRATKSIDLLVADEIDHALDTAGLERLMGVLDRKAKERGTVLVISHNSLSDWIPNTITVTKKDGLSTIEV